MVFQNDILAGASGAGVGYQIDQSIRFNDNDSAYLSRTMGTATDSNVWSFSWWGKRGVLDTNQALFSAYIGANNTANFQARFGTANQLHITGYSAVWRVTNRVFRDPSAFLHVLITVNTDEGVADDRIKVYINGVEETSFATKTNPPLGSDVGWNRSGNHEIGRNDEGNNNYYDGYMAEINFIDGQALAPTDFGEYNDDGVWIPKAYAGTYGTNGFYITGADSADLGADYSGNGNDFTSSGLTSDDQVTDTPTKNYATYTPLYGAVSYPATFSNGNLTAAGASGAGRAALVSTGTSTGKWYGEFTVDAVGTSILCRVGVVAVDNLYDPLMFSASEYSPQLNNVLYFANGTLRTYVPSYSDTPSWGSTFTTGDVIGVAYDADTGKVWFAKNNTWQSSGNPAAGTNPAVTLVTGTPFYFQNQIFDNTWTANFGQSGFTYTPPTGFSALSTANLPAPTIKDGSKHFKTLLYTSDNIGAGGSQAVTGMGFQPDFSWIKNRVSGSTTHTLYDAVRGAGKMLQSNATTAEDSNSIYGYLGSFDADGYTLTGGLTNANYINQSTNQYVSWNWLAANGTASNTNGSITSTVSANTTDGFSIVSYTGNATSGATIGHGLSQAPEVVITKSRDNGTGRNWAVYHADLGPTKYLELDNTNLANTGSTRWNDTAPSSTVVTLGSQQTTNDSGAAMIAYCWHSVEGFSKFGKYTGNGSTDGPFVWCGFRPAFVMTKRTDSSSNWFMYDSVRDIDNETYNRLFADLSDAEVTTTAVGFDLLSNGFKARNNNFNVNASGGTYVFMAFAEHPFGGDGVAPVPAR